MAAEEGRGPAGVGRRVRAARKLHPNLGQQQLATRMYVQLRDQAVR